MSQVASRELRNHTASVLERVQAGEGVTITVNGRPVAQLTGLDRSRRWVGRAELVARLRRAQADPALRRDLDRLVGDTTDDLDPLT